MTLAPILAHLAAGLPSLAMPAGAALPGDIQWMPPGKHEITATRAGEPVTYTITVNAAGAAAVAAALQSYRSAAAAGREDKPYLDFNHEDREASGQVLDAYWGGDDPVTGGIRLKVEWSAAGKAALEGKLYRRFSPSFFVNAGGEVTGAPLNMGGLVNRAAFKTINPIVAGQAGDAKKDTSMDAAQLAAQLAAANDQITQLNAKLATSTNEATIKAKDGEITTLKTKIAELEKTLGEQAALNAKAWVDAAVKDGRLAPQNVALHAQWVESLKQDPARKAMLDALPVNAALATIITNPGGGPANGGGNGADHAFLVKAKATAQALGKPVTDCFAIVAREHPELYTSYSESFRK